VIGVLVVAAGAFIAAPLRYFLDRWLTGRFRGLSRTFPIGLVVVNVSGSAVAGAVITTTTGTLRLFLLIGLCGTFTTFSGFGWHALQQWRTVRGAYWVTVFSMTVLCLAAFWITSTLVSR
jgi:CrcB protein